MIRRSTTTLTTSIGAVGLSLILHAGTANAQSSTTDRATAEALFQQGTELMAAKQYAKACEKFEGSHELDPALGTALRLADCYDRSGKTASAWAMFRDAASVAHRRAELDRQQIANERAADLEKRLSKIVLKVDAKNRPADLEIRLNGSLIPHTTWDTPIPVDPGRQRIEASAPGRISWSGSLDVADGPRVASLEVPALEAKGPELDGRSAATLGQPIATAGEDTPATRGGVQRAMGYVTGGLGIVGLLAGGYFSYRAYDFKQKSLDDCRVNDPNACTQAGKDLRDQSKSSATNATVAIAAGGVLLASGITLIVLSPHGDTRRNVGQLRFSPNPSALGGMVQFEGAW